MGGILDKARISEMIEQAERPLLWLAAAAVALYLVDLSGETHGIMLGTLALDSVLWGVTLAIDLVFVADLLAKLFAMGPSYRRSPWFVVDLVCALPVVATVSMAPATLASLRFVRMFRMLRALRMLRVLRTLRMLRFMNTGGATTQEQRTFHRVLGLSVLFYAVAFVLLVSWGRGFTAPGEVVRLNGVAIEGMVTLDVETPNGVVTIEVPAEQLMVSADRVELQLVLGSLLGMGLILLLSRYQIPALWSRQMRALLDVALPPQVSDHFMRHPEAYDATVRGAATVIFCDIKGFTSTVESIGLDELKLHLEQALDVVVEAHIAQDLIVDKFIGDAVMSFRGGDLVDGDPTDHAQRVVRAALDGMSALAALNNPFFKSIKVGGASADDALIGTFGASKRLSYTILGDRVNLAARLEASCNGLGVSTLFCDQTRQLVGDKTGVTWRRVGTIRVQGKEETTLAWEAFDQSWETAWIARFHEGLAHWEAQRFAQGIEAFDEVQAQREEGDGPSKLYSMLCKKWMTDAQSEAFSPVLSTTK